MPGIGLRRRRSPTTCCLRTAEVQGGGGGDAAGARCRCRPRVPALRGLLVLRADRTRPRGGCCARRPPPAEPVHAPCGVCACCPPPHPSGVGLACCAPGKPTGLFQRPGSACSYQKHTHTCGCAAPCHLSAKGGVHVTVLLSAAKDHKRATCLSPVRHACRPRALSVPARRDFSR